MARGNFIDRVVSYLSPEAGVRRTRARMVEDIISTSGRRRYDAAATGRRTSGWKARATSANSEIYSDGARLRDRARDMVRNDPYASRAVQALVSNSVGAGIIAKPISSSKPRAKLVATLWEQWALTTACDFYGFHDIYGLQTLALRTVIESGEVLIRRVRLTAAEMESGKLPVPLQIQVLEPDHLDSSKGNMTLASGGYVRQGIEFDKNGHRVAYHIFDQHPGEYGAPMRGLTSKRVPASEVKHIFKQDRAGQDRGVSFLAPILLKLRDFNEYEDAQLMRQKISACFTVAITEAGDDTGLLDGNGQQATSVPSQVEPGLIFGLRQGQDIKFGSPPAVEGYGDYSRAVLRGVATGLNIPYEVLTGDLSNVNFSSGRMGWLEFNRFIHQLLWGMFIPQFCDTTWQWFVEAAALVRSDLNEVGVEWTPPRREQVNPAEETKAAAAAVRAGFKARQDVIRENGDDPESVDQRIAEDNKRADKLGLVLDTDPRKLTQVGQLQMSNAPKTESPKSASNEEGVSA